MEFHQSFEVLLNIAMILKSSLCETFLNDTEAWIYLLEKTCLQEWFSYHQKYEVKLLVQIQPRHALLDTRTSSSSTTFVTVDWTISSCNRLGKSRLKCIDIFSYWLPTLNLNLGLCVKICMNQRFVKKNCQKNPRI